jgi:hypothetical protein
VCVCVCVCVRVCVCVCVYVSTRERTKFGCERNQVTRVTLLYTLCTKANNALVRTLTHLVCHDCNKVELHRQLVQLLEELPQRHLPCLKLTSTLR